MVYNTTSGAAGDKPASNQQSNYKCISERMLDYVIA